MLWNRVKCDEIIILLLNCLIFVEMIMFFKEINVYRSGFI